MLLSSGLVRFVKEVYNYEICIWKIMRLFGLEQMEESAASLLFSYLDDGKFLTPFEWS